jgi:hypothetical protein
MPRYFTRRPARASLWVEDDVAREGRVPDTPMVPDHEATDTGLLNAAGDTIWRAPPPMGFRFEDDD